MSIAVQVRWLAGWRAMPWRAAILVAWSVFAAACVSGSDPSNGAVRMLHAVADGPRMNLLIDEELRLAGIEFSGGSAFVTSSAGERRVRIEEVLPASGAATTDTIFDQTLSLAVNDELTLIVAGMAASGSEEVIEVRNRTRGVPFGKARVQVVHAAAGGPAVDVYITALDTVLSAVAPVAPALGYKAATEQVEMSGGGARVALTAVNDPTTVLYDSGPIFLNLESSLLLALVPDTAVAGSTSPFSLVVMSGTASVAVPDRNTGSQVRVVNAAPVAYGLDVIVNQTSVPGGVRQECDPGTTESGTVLEFCATSFTSIGSFAAIAAGSYNVNIQRTGADAVAAQTLGGSFRAGVPESLVLTGITDEAATQTRQGMLTLGGTRRNAVAAQLRVVSASLAADAAIAGDPATDRLELYITAPGADLAAENPDFVNFQIGGDTNYLSLAAGGYQLALARRDTAVSGAVPEVLYTRELTLTGGGLYTLVIADSLGGVLPLQALSLDDNPGP